nr:MAG TPA: Large polyvalent protein-associated domain 3 [Ackermannviridae sp.]
MVNRDLQAVKAAISQQNTMQKRTEKMQMRSLYANNTAESLIKGAKRAGYTVPASAYQPVQQAPQRSGGITADSLMKEYQQWLSEQQNTPQDLPSGGSAGSGYRQTLTAQDQQIPSLMDSVKNMSNDDIAKQINIANMVKDQKAQTQEEQDKNVADILSKLNGDSSMVDKARQLLNQRNTDYTSQTGKTDYDEAVQRTLQSAIPSLADNQPQSTENAQKAAQTDAQSYSNEAIAKIMADAGGGDEKALLDQLNNDPDLTKQAQSVLKKRDSDYAALTEKEPETQQATQRTSKSAKQAQSAYKQAQTATQTAKKKLETEQKKIDQNSQKLQSLQNSLAKAKKTAQKTGHYEQVNAIQQQIRGLQDTSADNKAFKKATEEYNKAKFNERAAKLKWANQALTNPVATKEPDQTAITSANGTFTQNQKEDYTTSNGKGGVVYNDDGTVTTRHGNDTRTTRKGVLPSLIEGLGQGFTSAAQGIAKAVSNVLGRPDIAQNIDQANKVSEQATKSNPKSYALAKGAGKFLNTALMYSMANGVGNQIGATDAAKSVIKNAIPGISEKALDIAANIVVGQAADTLIDTTPTAIQAYKDGQSGTELANTIAANQLQNLAFNAGGEALPSIFDALKKKGQTAEDANKEASDILSQYMNDTRGKENVQTGINNFINKAQNAQYPDEQAGSIVSAAKQNQKEIPSVKDAVEDSNVTNSIKDGSDWNPNKRISEILGRDVTMADDMKDGSVSLTEKIPSIENGVPKKAGRATTIYHPYKGEVPVQSTTSAKRTVISEGAISNSAESLKLATTENGKIDRGVLKRLYSKIFSDKGGQRKVTVDGVEFNGQPYDVSINNSSVGKIARSNLSKEQLSVFEDIDDVVKNGEYVGSADFVPHHAKNKNVLRYDYFETPVEIDGKDYFVTYDVEVYKGTNNYRTHKVIDEINLTERSSAPSSKGILNERVRQLPDISPDAPTQSSLSKADSKRVNANLNGSPSPTSKNVSSVEPSSIPSIDSTGENVNSVDELNKRGQNAFDQLVNDVKKPEGKASDIPDMDNGKAYTASGAVEKEADPEDAVDLMSERMSKRKSQTDNEGYIGRGYTNTIKNSGLATDEQYVKGLDEQTRHFTVPEKESFETGKAIYDSNPKAFVQKYSSSMGKDQLKALGSSDVDAMHIAYGKLNQMAKNATDPVEAESLRRQASSIARNLTDAQHYNAQTLQANAKWRNNIDGALMSADGTMKRLRDEALSPKEHSQIDDASQKISEMLKKMLDGKMETTSDNQLAWQEVKKALDGYSQLKGKFTDKQIQNLTDSVLKDKDWNGIQDLLEMQMTGYGGVSSEAIDKATMLFDEAQKYGYNSRKYMDLEQEAYNVLAKDIQSQPGYKGASFGQKLDSFRYLMMLGNPKTQVKNIAGNVLFGKLTDLKDDIGALIETAVDRANKASGGEGIQRTKSILNPLSESDKKLVSAAKEYGEEYAARALSGNKYTNPGVEQDKALSTFGNGKVGRFVQSLSDLTTKSLDKADQKAMMNKYQNALARYVKANGKDISIFSDSSQEAKDFLSMASDYAVHQAEEAAFHQDSKLASGLTNFATMLKNGNVGEKTAGTLIDATVPFKKTPINVLKSCLQYSPAEYVYAFADAYKFHRGEIDAAKFIDDMAKATTGTTMCVIGSIFAHAGIVQIGSDKGVKEQNTDTRTGRQQMAVKIGKQYANLSDLVPAASPFIIGATMYEAFKKNGKGIDALVDGLLNVESGLVDTTMLSGLSSVLNSVQYMQQGEEPINAVTRSVAESYAGQFLPTLGRAINSTADDTQRSSYSSKTGVGKEVESTAKYLETKIPGLQQVGDWADKNDIPVLNKLKLQPAIDAWGNVKKQNSAGVDAYTDNKVANAVGRGVANFATPTKLSADKSTDLDNKIRELKERLVSNGEMSAEDADNLFPYTATSEAKIGGEKLSEKDWTQYQIDKGTTSAELAKELLTSGKYDDLSDTDKADILQKIYKFSKSNTAAEYGGSASSSNSKLSEAYKSGGAKAVIDSMIGSSEKSSFTSAVQASNSEGKASIDNVIDYLNAVEKEDPAQAKELASQASEYQNGTYKKQSGKWVYQNKNTTKTGTGKAVTIPGPDEVGLPKTSTKVSTKSTETVPDMSSKLSEVRKNKDKAIAAIKKGESADSAVVNAGYWANRNYESRYSKYSSAKIPGLNKSEENFKLIYQTMDSDRNGNLKKKEVVDYINSQKLTAEQKRAMFSAFANKNWKNPF